MTPRTANDPFRILAIDVGGGTQDVLIYDSDRRIENCFKLILPARTQIVAAQIRRATADGVDIHLSGSLMGGGASGEAVERHLEQGLAVSATADAARTIHNDLEKVRRLGVTMREAPPPNARVVTMGDVDLDALAVSLAAHGIAMPDVVAVAVQDHGYLPGAGGRAFRSEYLTSLLERGGEVSQMIYRDPPEYMSRMRTVVRDIPGAFVMDTGAAAVLGALGDEHIARHVLTSGGILVNIGNLHTFAVAMRGSRMFGLFEHHTAGVTPAWLRELVERLQAGTLTDQDVLAQGGHGSAFSPQFGQSGSYGFVAVTGPNRHLADELGYYQAAPHGDMMLTGAYGLVEGVLRRMADEGQPPPVRTLVEDVVTRPG